MQQIEIENLLKQITDEAPCGEDLSYDPAYQVLESSAAPKAAQEFGDIFVPAAEPDWQKVLTLSIEILTRTKDLRIAATYLAHALVHTQGFSGCMQALLLVQDYLEHYWDTVHPQLDSDDNDDPTSRLNAIQALSDKNTLIQTLRLTPLISVKGFGKFGLRDMDIADGKLTVSNEGEATLPTTAMIESVLMEIDMDELKNKATTIDESLACIKQIKTLLIDLVGGEKAPELQALSDELNQAHKVLKKELSRRGVVDDAEKGLQENNNVQSQSTAGGGGTSTGEVSSRTDIIQMLDKICDYYARYEPSSPLPLLLQRAKRLVSMDFMDIMKDIASDGVPQAQKIVGVDGDKVSGKKE